MAHTTKTRVPKYAAWTALTGPLSTLQSPQGTISPPQIPILRSAVFAETSFPVSVTWTGSLCLEELKSFFIPLLVGSSPLPSKIVRRERFYKERHPSSSLFGHNNSMLSGGTGISPISPDSISLPSGGTSAHIVHHPVCTRTNVLSLSVAQEPGDYRAAPGQEC